MIGSAAEFDGLQASFDDRDRARVAHDSATDATWRQIVDGYPDLRVLVAENKTVPLTILELLAVDPCGSVRQAVATKRKLTPSLLLRFASDTDVRVRSELARNPKLTVEAMAVLAVDPDAEVRSSLAENRRLPEGLRQSLARDTADDVRRSLAHTFPDFEVMPWAEDEGVYLPGPEAAAEHLSVALSERLWACWTKQWSTAAPIGHQLRLMIPDQWFRFHSLPRSKRYPELETEYQEVLRRHIAVLEALSAAAPSTAANELIVLTASTDLITESRGIPERDQGALSAFPDAMYWRTLSVPRADWDSDGPDLAIHLFVSQVDLRSPQLLKLLRSVADHVTGDVIITDNQFTWLYHPYDGGADVFPPTTQQRDEIRSQFAAWLSRHPEGL